MSEFVAAALGFPTALFSFLLVVVVGYWLLVIFGAADPDALDSGEDLLPGLGGVPATVTLSLLVALAWFVSLAGSVLLHRSGWPAVLSIAVLLIALVAAWLGTRLLALALRPLFANGPQASRTNFIGRLCVIRTGGVALDFGQAEVTAADGSSAIVQVRQTGDAPLRAGSTALIYDFDADGEFFWVTPADATP